MSREIPTNLRRSIQAIPMIALIQRVTHASVRVDNQLIAEINQGLLVLLGVEKLDDEAIAQRLVDKVLGYRVFSDAEGKMNLDVKQIGGEVLVVPQFTLVADTNKGLRPSFSKAAPPEQGIAMFDVVVDIMQRNLESIKKGQFGADMAVQLTNDGPVTFWIQV